MASARASRSIHVSRHESEACSIGLPFQKGLLLQRWALHPIVLSFADRGNANSGWFKLPVLVGPLLDRRVGFVYATGYPGRNERARWTCSVRANGADVRATVAAPSVHSPDRGRAAFLIAERLWEAVLPFAGHALVCFTEECAAPAQPLQTPVTFDQNKESA